MPNDPISGPGWDALTAQLAPTPQPSGAEDAVALGTGGRALRTGDHAAIVYFTAQELLDTVVPYLREGLRAGDKVVYVADETELDQLRAALDRGAVDVGAAEGSGRLVLATAEACFFQGGTFEVERALDGVRTLARQAKAEGFRRVRFSVEMTYLLAQVPGIERGPEFEARANREVFAQFPFVCVCSFNGNRDDGAAVRDVLETHPVLLSKGIPLSNPYYRRWPEGAGALAPGRERARAPGPPRSL